MVDDEHIIRCDRKRCRNIAEVFPLIMIPAPKWSRAQSKIAMEMDLNVCLKHADSSNVDEFVDDLGYKQLRKAFRLRRIVLPGRKQLKIDFKPLSERSVAK